jgi:hypothetical protein
MESAFRLQENPSDSFFEEFALERFPGRLNLGVFSCWREYDSSFLL